ncbi:MAG: type II secretion system protein N [Burkholderiaceae bacterium]
MDSGLTPQRGRGTPGPSTGRSGVRSAALAWSIAGFVVGGLLALVLCAPASWLADALARLSQGRVLLLQAEGTVWSGQATLALGSGPGGGPAVALPGRLLWSVRPQWLGRALPELALELAHAQAMPEPIRIGISPTSAGWHIGLRRNPAGGISQLQAPAAWLNGLGAPWNTLQPSGSLRVEVEDLQWTIGSDSRPKARMSMSVKLVNAASRVSTLPVLGHYELAIRGGPEMNLVLSSGAGSALQLEGMGLWTPGQALVFRGQALAASGRQEALSNLLNIIGRREGDRSIIALGQPVDSRPASVPHQ